MASEIEENQQVVVDLQKEKEEHEVNNLFEDAMRDQWMKVVDVYKKYRSAREAKLTNAEDTALHIAISAGCGDIVQEMVNCIPNEDASKVLKIENKRKNTPLHLAAALGNVAICHCIASKDHNLISARNVEGETPLFLAAHHGKQDAFICLHELHNNKRRREEGPDYTPCRKSTNGDTILHSAIYREYFSFASLIIEYYAILVDSVNENGWSPLHVLASKPNVFSSCSRLSLYDRIIYHCIFVSKIEKKTHDHGAYKDISGGKGGFEHPTNYQTCMDFFQLLRNVIWILVSYTAVQPRGGRKQNCSSTDEENPPKKSNIVLRGYGRIKKIQEKKEKHTWALQIMNKLVKHASSYKYDNNGRRPIALKDEVSAEFPTLSMVNHDDTGKISSAASQNKDKEKEDQIRSGKKETPILIAAKMGITEMVKEILDKFPVAIQDLDSNKKNVLLLAVENRQTDVYNLLLSRSPQESLFRQVDDKGNSALHLAATFGEQLPWLIPGAALQMQWEIKWYKFVKHSIPPQFFNVYNNKGEIAKEIFTCTHNELVKYGSKWITKTSESCSVVAALIATVAFASSTTFPGGMDDKTGTPVLKSQPAFDVFAISSVVALCFSVTAVVFFLTILTSRCQAHDFNRKLPRMLLLGLTSLFTSIASILISFCAGHFFVLKDELKYAAIPIYAVTCLPVTFFAFAQLPLYLDLVSCIFAKVPQRSYKKFPK